jgi:hypothetical protein
LPLPLLLLTPAAAPAACLCGIAAAVIITVKHHPVPPQLAAICARAVI